MTLTRFAGLIVVGLLISLLALAVNALQAPIIDPYELTSVPREGTLSPAAYDWHSGVDLSVPNGTAVYSRHTGRIVQIGGWAGDYSVFIEEDVTGRIIAMGHMDNIQFLEGVTVFPGQIIGYVGDRGTPNEVDDHLHLEMSTQSWDQYRDALNFIFSGQRFDMTKMLDPFLEWDLYHTTNPEIKAIRYIQNGAPENADSSYYFLNRNIVWGPVDIVAQCEVTAADPARRTSLAGIWDITYSLSGPVSQVSQSLFEGINLLTNVYSSVAHSTGQLSKSLLFDTPAWWYTVTNTGLISSNSWSTRGNATLNRTALFPDGHYHVNISARNRNGSSVYARDSAIVDNFAPYLESISIKTGSTNNLRYSANWSSAVNAGDELDSSVTANNAVDALSKWTVTLTFSESMDTSVTPTVTMKFPNGTTRALTSPPSAPPTWSADGKTFTLITSTRPLGNDPVSDTTATLSITAKDAAGNQLDRNPKTVGVRQNANPIPNGDPGADENHYIHIEEWNVDVRGVVMDESGDSKQGVRIKFFRNGEFDTEIGVGVGASKGRWSRTKLPGGYYHAYAYLNGYAPTLVDIGLLEEGDTRWIEIRLPAQSVISGTVRRSTDNAPVTGAILEASFRLDLSPHGDTTLMVKTDTSGGGGAFSIGSLPAGQISVEVSRSRYDTVTQDVTTSPGQTTARDFTLTPDPGIIAVTVERQLDGSMIENAAIKAEATNLQSGTNFQSPLNGTTDAEGKASLSNVGPALYTVSANHSEYFSDTVFNQQVLPGETLSILFRLVKKAKYTGRVLDLNDNPVQGVTVTISGSSTTVTTDADGWFTFAGLPPGSYTLTLTKTGFVTKNHSFSVTDGEEKSEEIKIQKLGLMSGTVLNVTGNPLQGATVTVSGGGTTKTATSDASGSFSIADLPPGTYTITGSLTGYVTQTGSKDVPDGGNATVTIILPKLGGITGSVKDNNAQPINGASVTISKGAAAHTTTSDAGGTFTFADLEAGTWNISASASGYSSQAGTVTVVNDQDASVTIVLQAVGQISGTVSSSLGGGVAGATVTAGSYSATTDGNGNYTISSLPHGNYTVSASKAGYTGGSSVSVTVSSSPATANFMLTPLPGSISGSVNVSASITMSGPVGGSASGTSFNFTNLPAGTYSLTASASGYQTQTQSMSLSPGQNAGVTFTLQPVQGKGTIRVTVKKIGSRGTVVAAQNTYVQVSGPVTTGHNTNFSGIATFPDLPLGTYSVSCAYGSGSVTLSYNGQIANIQLGP